MPTLEGCRERQRRLLQYMERVGLATAVLSRPKSICYFTGILPDPTWPHALVTGADGDSVLVTNLEPKKELPARVRTYTGYSIHKVFGRETGHDETATLVGELVERGPTGVESEWVSGGMMAAIPGPTQNLTPSLIEMRRRKMADEIESMRATAGLASEGYKAIKQRLEPGMTEIDAYLIIYEAIVTAAGTSVELNGDFACGVRAIGGGGPPMRRIIENGDLCIFDLFPIFDGYMCDLCRTFVAGQSSSEQHDTWAHVLAAHDIARRQIRPGASTRAVYEEIRTFLERHPGTKGSFTHHAGHGVGIDGWEQPWLNAGSDQTFVEGEVIACEPGLYSEALRGGIRLEHNYLVTQDGPVPIDTFPMDL
jgi:Xaa-Pro aminopeptidase